MKTASIKNAFRTKNEIQKRLNELHLRGVPLKPPLELLTEFAPDEAWEEVISQAKRSPMNRYGIGAVLLDGNGKIISTGCAHPNIGTNKMATTHAEIDCLRRAGNIDLREATCLVYTLNSKHTACAWTSKPCLSCAQRLVRRGVRQAVFAERDLNGNWQVQVDKMKDICPNANYTTKDINFARYLTR